ncbi:MAG: neuraminidase-like domain-containing protein [Polyangiaceae bacterium]
MALPEVKERWEWMRNYRVWEANRKVFLYPENWIEPELRDDKTPFFKELEAELLEREASDESGKVALANYLEKLDEVSDLEVVGATRQEVNANGISYILHVVGRTRSRTRSFFYRTFQGRQFFDGTWTPWVKIDLDIKGEVVLPCVFNGRLFLSWASIKIKQSSKPVEDNKNNEVTGYNVAETRAEHHADIQLMWSEYAAEQKKWLKTCVSKQAVVDLDAQSPFAIEANPEQLPPECYHLRLVENGNEAFTVAVIKTNLPAAAGALEPKVLGRFRIWSNGHDSVEGPPKDKLSLKSNWPVSTILKSNQAEETSLTIESEQPSDSFKFKGSTVLLSRTPEHYRVFATNFDYTDGQATNPFFFITNTKCFFGLNRGAVIQGGLAKEKTLRIKLQTFNHPHTRVLQSLLQDNGPSAIMCRPTEAMPASQNYYYNYTSSHSNYYYNYYGSMLLGYYIAGDGLARWNMERKFENRVPTDFDVLRAALSSTHH